jgi:hypothetical protein
MADITSRDDERTAEQARKQGQEEEKGRQRELEQAKDQARKEGRGQERASQKAAGGPGTVKIIIYLIVLAVIVAAVAWLSLSVTVTNVDPGDPMPFTTTYGVSFPEGQTITVGNVHISTLSNQGLIITDIDGSKQNMVVGDERVISERRAVIKTLGVITLLDTHFQIGLKYKGERENRAYFDMAVHTSQQVPDILLKQLLPNEIDARPI